MSDMMGSKTETKVLNIARDFTRYPGPRHEADGPDSGEKFRDEKLVPALKEAAATGGVVVVELDGARGYTASFLEEAFGGLIRLRGYTKDQLDKLLDIRTSDPRIAYWRARIKEYIDDASKLAPAR